ncbi:hypothetical protein FrEUN1fDRAFT_4467 [Parafrankia sp. EUN1f]|nr:hypothetical protein FrEUN1fDRAFT_4467 [Parafrankia sp. EUN1f]
MRPDGGSPTPALCRPLQYRPSGRGQDSASVHTTSPRGEASGRNCSEIYLHDANPAGQGGIGKDHIGVTRTGQLTDGWRRWSSHPNRATLPSPRHLGRTGGPSCGWRVCRLQARTVHDPRRVHDRGSPPGGPGLGARGHGAAPGRVGGGRWMAGDIAGHRKLESTDATPAYRDRRRVAGTDLAMTGAVRWRRRGRPFGVAVEGMRAELVPRVIEMIGGRAATPGHLPRGRYRSGGGAVRVLRHADRWGAPRCVPRATAGSAPGGRAVARHGDWMRRLPGLTDRAERPVGRGARQLRCGSGVENRVGTGAATVGGSWGSWHHRARPGRSGRVR